MNRKNMKNGKNIVLTVSHAIYGVPRTKLLIEVITCLNFYVYISHTIQQCIAINTIIHGGVQI